MKRTMQSHYDPALEVYPRTPKAVRMGEAFRLAELHAIAAGASLIPRRLGGDATAKELSIDKKTCRKVAHTASSLASLWGPVKIEDQELLKKMAPQAAQVRWVPWLEEHIVYLSSQRAYIATWAIKFGHRSEGNSFIHRLNLEEEELINSIW